MGAYEILQSDSWFYTGLTTQQYNNAMEKGTIEPIYLGPDIEKALGYGLYISKEEALIDSIIEGLLAVLYGAGKFCKLWVRIPQGTILYVDLTQEGKPLTYIVTISIPVADSAYVGKWEGVPYWSSWEEMQEFDKGFGRRLPP